MPATRRPAGGPDPEPARRRQEQPPSSDDGEASGIDQFRAQLEGLGRFIRSQRTLANLSLRELAERTNVSNPYLSQIERGLHEPSVRVLRSIARALNLSAETLLAQAGLLEGRSEEGPAVGTEDAIRADPYLTDAQKEALLSVYRSYRAAN